MTEGNGRISKGNLVRVLNLILKELVDINKNIKALNSKPEVFEKDLEPRFRNQNNSFRK